MVPHVTGFVHDTRLGANTHLVAVQGQYTVSVQPPAIGTFTYGGHTVSNVPVTTVK